MIKLRIDLGSDIGEMKSSTHIVKYFATETNIGWQVMSVINFSRVQTGKFMS